MQLNDYQQLAASTAVYAQNDFADFLQGCVLASIEDGDTTLRMPTDEFKDLLTQLRTVYVYYTAMGLAGEAGEVANKAKKIFRDDTHFLYRDRKDAIKKELGGVLWYAAMMAKECGLTLDEIAETNVAELKRRKEEGTIHGDGDDR